MSFPNRHSSYEEAINDLKRKLMGDCEREPDPIITQPSHHTPTSGNGHLEPSRPEATATEPPALAGNSRTESRQSELSTVSSRKSESRSVKFHFSSELSNRDEALERADSRVTEDDCSTIDLSENDHTDPGSETEGREDSRGDFSYTEFISDNKSENQTDAQMLRIMLEERDQILKDYAVKLNAAESELRQTRKTTRLLQQEKTLLEQELDESNKSVQRESSENRQFKETINDLKFRMKDLEAKALVHSTCDPEMTFLQSSLTDFVDENENLRSSLKSKADLIQSLTQQFESREQRLTESNKQLQERHQELLDEIKESQSKLEITSRDFEKSQSERELVSRDLSKVQSEMSNLSLQLNESESERARLQKQVHEKDKLIGAVNDEFNNIQEDNQFLEERLSKLETELDERNVKVQELTEQLSEARVKSMQRNHQSCSRHEGLSQEKVDALVKQREQELQDSFKRKLKREVEFARHSTSKQVTKELRHKHLKELEKMRADLEEAQRVEVEGARREQEDAFHEQLEQRLGQKEAEFRATMDRYQAVIHKLEEKVKSQCSDKGTLAEVEAMLHSLIQYTSGATHTIYLDVTHLNTQPIKDAFQQLTTKIFELIDEIAFLTRQGEHGREVRRELEEKLEATQRDSVPSHMYREVYNSYMKVMREQQGSTEQLHQLVSKHSDASLLDVLRNENIQLLQNKVSLEQTVGKLRAELEMLRDGERSQGKDAEDLQIELFTARQDCQDLEDTVTALKDEVMMLTSQVEKLASEKDSLEAQMNRDSTKSLREEKEELMKRMRELVEKNEKLSDQLDESVDRETLEKLHLATKELLKQNDELNSENDTLMSEITQVTKQKERLETELQNVSEDDVFQGHATKRVKFDLSGLETPRERDDDLRIDYSENDESPEYLYFDSKSRNNTQDVHEQMSESIRQHEDTIEVDQMPTNSPDDAAQLDDEQLQVATSSIQGVERTVSPRGQLVAYRPNASDVIEEQLALENTQLFAVNTKLFSERERLKEQLFRVSSELDDARALGMEEKKEIRDKLNSQKMSLQRLSSKVRIYSYQSTSPTELELKIKRDLMDLESQINDLLENFQEQKMCSPRREIPETIYLYEISSESSGEDSTESGSVDERNQSDIDEKLQLAENSIAEKSKEIEALRKSFAHFREVARGERHFSELSNGVMTNGDSDRGGRSRKSLEYAKRLGVVEREMPPHRSVVTTVSSVNVVTLTEQTSASCPVAGEGVHSRLLNHRSTTATAAAAR